MPYKIEQDRNTFYVKVLTYNNQVWYPWSYSYISDEDYPTSQKRYAREFKSQADAESFLNSLLK
jgi:hypothetical protein